MYSSFQPQAQRFMATLSLMVYHITHKSASPPYPQNYADRTLALNMAWSDQFFGVIQNYYIVVEVE